MKYKNFNGKNYSQDCDKLKVLQEFRSLPMGSFPPASPLSLVLLSLLKAFLKGVTRTVTGTNV